MSTGLTPSRQATQMRMNQAVSRAIADEMRLDESVVVWGEDVAEAGGVFKTTVGLLEEFGPHRVRDTPISEMGFLGAAVGAAASGLRPVVEIMFIEFIGVALDQLATQAAFFRYLSAGGYSMPLTIRGSMGGALGFGAQHSQTLERWFIGTPGLKVVVASGPRTAYGLIRSAIRDDGPVVVLEPRLLYSRREEIAPSMDLLMPLGRAELIGRGNDLTLIGLGNTVTTIQEAASRSNWSADIIDLLSVVPWDHNAVLESVRRTSRLVIVEENPKVGGWGSHVAALIAAEARNELSAPIVRITAPDVPVPFAPSLERKYLPSADETVFQVDELLRTGEPPRPWWEREKVQV